MHPGILLYQFRDMFLIHSRTTDANNDNPDAIDDPVHCRNVVRLEYVRDQGSSHSWLLGSKPIRHTWGSVTFAKLSWEPHSKLKTCFHKKKIGTLMLEDHAMGKYNLAVRAPKKYLFYAHWNAFWKVSRKHLILLHRHVLPHQKFNGCMNEASIWTQREWTRFPSRSLVK